MSEIIVGKRQRDADDDIEYENEYLPNNNKKLKADENINVKIKNKYKTINEIKNETYKKYINLSEEDKNNNNILLKLINDFDINEIINLKVLYNNLNAIKYNLKSLKNSDIFPLTEIFIKNYERFRFTISTEERKKLLNEYIYLTNNNNKFISDINFNYECVNPKELLKNFLLNIVKIYIKCTKKKIYFQFLIFMMNYPY